MNKLLKYIIVLIVPILLVADDTKFYYVYDVEKDKCNTTIEYNNEFGNPSFIGKFEKSLKVLVFISQDNKMYVFAENLQDCLDYQAHFQDEFINLNNKEKKDRDNDNSIFKE